jgi:hypothetical protein
MTTTGTPPSPLRDAVAPPPVRPTAWRGLTLTTAALAALLATAAVLGPLVLELVTYRTSPTTLNQLLGSDAAVLLVVAPAAAAAAVLAARRSPLAPALAGGVGVFAVYTYVQVVVGQEYLRLPGNVERFFPLYLAVVVLAQAAVVLAARGPRLPRPGRRLERAAAITLLLEAVFLVVGLHLPTMVTAWRDPGALADYASSPTPFWLVKLMDLGIVVPASIAAGVGLLRGAAWARRLMHTLLTACTCLGASVTAMAVMMLLHDDPGASAMLAVGFAGFTLVFAGLTAAALRSLAAGSEATARTIPE